MERKKGLDLNNGFAAILIVVLVAVLVIVGIFLFDTLGTTFPGRTTTTVNETFTGMTNETAVIAGNASACNFADFAVTAAYNSSSGDLVPANNYTATAATGSLISIATNCAGVNGDTTGSGLCGWDWNVTYTYSWGGEACEANDDMITQFATYPALVGLVGTIVFLGLVIGVLVGSFVFGGRRRV